eukprot:107136-Ditylum_brightwellii.AAC.1
MSAVSPLIIRRAKDAYGRTNGMQHLHTGENPVKKVLLVASGQDNEVQLDKVPELEEMLAP